ncbi:Movement protein [Labeo rohita]|uniref:Movement protein n=1 Tax=Labeo rohita TaxID=84645 RepID=A0ABQ8MMP8_LABRO|nr:Movement protein [Labeo rohita]
MVGRPPQGGREWLFTQQQELAIIEMTVLDFDAAKLPHDFIYVDEAGFNQAKTRCRGRNVVGPRGVVNVPDQCGGNVTLCAAISVQGVLHHHATLGPYNTGQIIAILDALHAVRGSGKYMIGNHTPAWNSGDTAETLRWDQSKGGFSTQGDIFPIA